MVNLASLYAEQALYDKAEPLRTEALETQRRLKGDRDPDTPSSMDGLAHIYMHQGRYEESEGLLERTLEIKRRVHGEDHDETFYTVYRQACLKMVRGRQDAAIRLLRDAVDRGWAKRFIFTDPDMKALRGNADFEALTERINEKLPAIGSPTS